MAKKRTLVPFYGKKHQAMEQHAAALLKAGKNEEAANIAAAVSESLKAARQR